MLKKLKKQEIEPTLYNVMWKLNGYFGFKQVQTAFKNNEQQQESVLAV